MSASLELAAADSGGVPTHPPPSSLCTTVPTLYALHVMCNSGRRVGVLSTRAPYRPNPIGLSLARLDRVDGGTLYLSGLDAVDGTPVYDIKPCVLHLLSLSFIFVHSFSCTDIARADLARCPSRA